MNTSVSAQFHSIIASGNYVTRLRIYSIPESIDCTDDNAVQTNGTLLVLSNGDGDSNGRISQGGLTLTDYFNKETDVEIGETVSCEISTVLMNSDGALNDYEYGKFKAYLDVAPVGIGTWQTASLGVFYWSKPTKCKVQLVSAVARDQMQLFDEIATDWFDSLDFGSGLTLLQILTSMANTLGVHLHSDTATNLVNGSHVYDSKPFDAESLTYRDILGWIAGVAGGNARFDRNGFLTIRYFDYAMTSTPSGASSVVGYAVVGTEVLGAGIDSFYTLNNTTLGGGIFSIDIAEYSVPQIDKLIVKSSDADYGTIVGDGLNAYELVNNPLMNGATFDDIIPRATNVFNRIAGLETYSPISISAMSDWSIEAGDIIYVVASTGNYVLPIFQQKIVWNGVSVRTTMESAGATSRPVQSKQNRMEYRSNRSIHQLEVTAEQLLSLIQESDDNYSQISQTVDSISTTVSGLSDSLGTMRTDITELADSVEVGFNNTNNDIRDIYSFVRLIPTIPGVQEGGVVIGESSNPIKLKLENDVLYFFTGDERDVNKTNAIAYFSTDRLYVTNSTIKNITLGTNTNALDVRILGSGDNVCAFFGGRINNG